MKKIFFLLTFLIFNFQFLISIEVGGHLTQDTIWSPENNPYEVTEVLYVDEGVTLTILPGTEIKISAAPLTCYSDLNNFKYYNGNPVAKMFWVDGKIIAEGTEDQNITFNRLQDEENYFWGIIYITSIAEMCRFQYCKFEYAQEMMIAVGHTARGTISSHNYQGLFRHNIFQNNHYGIWVTYASDAEKLKLQIIDLNIQKI